MLLGIAYRTVGSPEMIGEAKAELVQAVAIDGANLPARYFLASSISSWDGRPRRKEELEAALAQAPGRPQFLALLGEAERQSEEPATRGGVDARGAAALTPASRRPATTSRSRCSISASATRRSASSNRWSPPRRRWSIRI